MTYFAEMPSLFSDHDDVTKHLLLEKGKLPSYLRDHRKRLRERFLSGGANALPDYEMLELVLFRAIPRPPMKSPNRSSNTSENALPKSP